MSDYISREAAITTYKTFGHLNLHNAIEAFNEIPAADVRPVVKGEWIEREDIYGWNVWECSACHEEFCVEEGTPADNQYNFCLNCGADMRRADE